MYKDTKYQIMVENYEIMKENAKTLAKRIDKAIEILKDTSVEMSETLLIETIDYAIHILKGEDKE